MRKLIAVVLFFGGCQCVGLPSDYCEETDNCPTGYICLEGLCQKEESPDASTPVDASEPLDSGSPDSGQPDDAGSPDSGSLDSGLPDSGSSDGGEADAGFNPCIPNPCTFPKGICTPGAQAVCSCDPGYHDVSGNCVQDQSCLPNSCGGHGTCTNPGGVVTCSCDQGYVGQFCGLCATNWQDNNSDGVCLMACSNPSLSLNCNGNGICLDTSGTAICACYDNWTGSDCNSCVSGNYVNGSGRCVDDPCLPNPCQNGGACSRPVGVAVCSCDGNWTGSDCSTCPVGFGGSNCDPLATLTVTQNSGAVTTLFASDLQVLKWRIGCQGGSCSVAKQTISYQFSGGSWSVIGQTLSKNIDFSDATFTRSAGRIVIQDPSEDAVPSGGYNDYLLYLTITGSGSSGNTLTVTLLGDSAATPTMVGSTGFVYNTAGSRLFVSASGLCSANPPNFVWSGLAHTAPSPACSIASFGTPDYSTGFEIGAWSISNTLTAP